MGIAMQPEEFPRRRRNDSKEQAYAFDASQDLRFDGYGPLEFSNGREGHWTVNPYVRPSVGRFVVQVKGGRYRPRNCGENPRSARPDNNLN